jgi:hypothetical protein
MSTSRGSRSKIRRTRVSRTRPRSARETTAAPSPTPAKKRKSRAAARPKRIRARTTPARTTQRHRTSSKQTMRSRTTRAAQAAARNRRPRFCSPRIPAATPHRRCRRRPPSPNSPKTAAAQPALWRTWIPTLRHAMRPRPCAPAIAPPCSQASLSMRAPQARCRARSNVTTRCSPRRRKAGVAKRSPRAPDLLRDTRGVEIHDGRRAEGSDGDTDQRQNLISRIWLGLFHLLRGQGASKK